MKGGGSSPLPPVVPRAAQESAFNRFFARPRLGLLLAAVAVVLCSPCLVTGFHLDDFIGRYAYTDLPGARDLYRVLDAGFGVGNGRPDEALWQVEMGYAPWWIHPTLLVRMMRPVSLLTHLVDFRLLGDSAFLMHAQSLAWFFALVLVATRLYRGVHGAVAGGLAATLYAFDHTHGFAVGFICNRNALTSATFGLLALSQYRAAVAADGRTLARWVGPALYLVALLSGEASIAVLGYVLAFAAFVDARSLVRRGLGVLPYLVVTVCWRMAYSGFGYGGRGSGLYLDPGREPLHFLQALLERAPLLLVGQFLAPPAELYMVGDRALALFMRTESLVFLACFALAAAPLLARDRVARFWAAGMLFSLVPASTTHPSNRLLFFVSVGAAGLIASFWNLYAVTLKGVAVSGVAWFSRAFGGVMLLGHLLLSPLVLPLAAFSIAFTAPIDRAFADVGPDAGGKDAVFVSAPDYYSVKLMRAQKAKDGEPLPRRFRVLSFGAEPLVVRRTDDRTLLVTYEHGILSEPLLELYRDRRIPMAPGDRVVLAGLVIEVREITADGRAKVVSFAFDTPLEAPSFRFYSWEKGFRPFALPAVGAEVRVPPARLELGLGG